MANIAPIIASPQQATQSSAHSNSGSGSESSFGSILSQTVASNKSAPRKSTSKVHTPNSRTEQDHHVTKARLKRAKRQHDAIATKNTTSKVDNVSAEASQKNLKVQTLLSKNEGSLQGNIERTESIQIENVDLVATEIPTIPVMLENTAHIVSLDSKATLDIPEGIGNAEPSPVAAFLNEENPSPILTHSSKTDSVLTDETVSTELSNSAPPARPDNAAVLVNHGSKTAPVIGEETGNAEFANPASPVRPDNAAVVVNNGSKATQVIDKGTANAEFANSASPVRPDNAALVIDKGNTPGSINAEVIAHVEIVNTATSVRSNGVPIIANKEDQATSDFTEENVPVLPKRNALPITPGRIAIVEALATSGPEAPEMQEGLPLDQPRLATSISQTWSPSTSTLPEQAALPPVYFATNQAKDVPGVPSNEPRISASLQELIGTHETGVAVTSNQSVKMVPLENLVHLTQRLDISAISTTITTQLQQDPATSELTPLIASFNQLITLKTPATDTSEKSSPTHIEPLRQDIKGQALEAKIDAQNKDTNNQDRKSAQQELTTSSQIPTNQTSTSPTTENTLTYSQVSQGVLSQTLPHNTQIAAQPINPIPHPGTPLHEESVLNQVAERFQFHSRNQETQMHIKLHPEELGEIKIDLTMKEGSIRANVVAQSGQVQEILEKHMTRLKSILEGHGFTIEEIVVSTKSDDIAKFDLLQDRSSKQDTPDRQSRQNSDSSFNDTFENIVTALDNPITSVNITA